MIFLKYNRIFYFRIIKNHNQLTLKIKIIEAVYVILQTNDLFTLTYTIFHTKSMILDKTID
ncbi:hypothetical protein A9X61_04620 [Enterobacter asburiae]|nr:hypothetical protein A9X61_04620 [Enterobacter asburiae]